MKRIAAAVLALALPGAAWAQGGEPLGDIADPSTVRWRQVGEISIVVFGCSDWPDAFVISCPVTRAPPPKVCTLDRAGIETVFGLLAAGRAIPGREPPPPSTFFHFRIAMKLTDGKTLIVAVPLYPNMEEDGDHYLWITYGTRRVRIDRASWDRISELAQSAQCARVETRW